MSANTSGPAPPVFDARSRRAYRYSVSGLCPGIPRAGDRQAVQALLDVLGEDVANELVDWFNAVDLTYRTDLRELNELNFARFDAKLEQRLAEFDARLRTELAALRAEFRTELAGLRTELVRWMFAFWVTNFIGIAGLLIALRGH